MFSLTSKDYNEILMDKIQEMDKIKKDIDDSNLNIEKRIKIIELQNKINYILLEKVKNSKDNNHILLLDSINDKYMSTGITVHPEVIGSHNNILNLTVSKNGTYHFREDVEALIEEEDITYILKHDSILDKEVNLIENKNDTIDIMIYKKSNKLSPFIINSIEIDTYIQDVIDIKEIIFYNKEIEVGKIKDIKNIGKSLHPLNKTIQFDKVKITVKSKYKNEDNNHYIYPIKHIYFYNSVYDKNSYCIYQKELDSPISYIEDKVKIINHKDEITQSINESDITIYMDPDLSLEIMPDVILAKDITTLYIKVPLAKDGKIKSIKSLKFFEKYR